MNDLEFNLDSHQIQICHELTMEFIRQNNAFCMTEKDEDGKLKRSFDKVCDNYFEFYKEFAIRLNDRREDLENPFSKIL